MRSKRIVGHELLGHLFGKRRFETAANIDCHQFPLLAAKVFFKNPATKLLDQRVTHLLWGFRDASKVHVTRSSAYGHNRSLALSLHSGRRPELSSKNIYR
jgi:hypothetical protein